MAAQQVDAGRLDPLDLAVVLPVGGHAIAVRQDGLGLITGASSGLGKALAEHVLAHGDQVVATASSTQATTELAARYPETALAVRLDVTEPADREAAVRAAEAIHQAVSAPELAHWVVQGQRRPAAYRGQAGPGAGRVRGRPGVGVQYGLPGGRRQRGALSLTGNAAPVAGRGTCHRRRSSCGVWSARVGQTVMVLYSV
ncbi:SDR family NAD(P)-dependent oxidoreductase [Streptomyces antimycoticus]|uniref:SDR family NAD(P)-dependent oxidoreductase n=1 Tax=Streptomyces antimycoticus TaxID=68175 RepID=UPI0036C55E5F